MSRKRDYIAEVYTGSENVSFSKNNFRIIPAKSLKKTSTKRIVGYVKNGESKYTDKEFGTLIINNNNKEYKYDIYSRKPALTSTYGYIKVGENEYVMIVRFPPLVIIIPLLLILIVIGFIILNLPKETEAIEPDKPLEKQQEVIKEEEKEEVELKAEVILPEAEMKVEGTIKKPKENHLTGMLFMGRAGIQVTIQVNNETHVLLDTYEAIEEGTMPDIYIDYTKLDFELVPGVYYGTAYITYTDGSVEEYSICVVIRQSMGGVMEVSYSNEIQIDLNNSLINLTYKQGPSTNNTKVQVILVKDDKEYVLAESGEIEPGESLETLTLENSFTSLLQEGVYTGLLRITILNNDSSVANINNDIDVTITVQ